MAVILNPITGLLNFAGLRLLAFEMPLLEKGIYEKDFKVKD